MPTVSSSSVKPCSASVLRRDTIAPRGLQLAAERPLLVDREAARPLRVLTLGLRQERVRRARERERERPTRLERDAVHETDRLQGVQRVGETPVLQAVDPLRAPQALQRLDGLVRARVLDGVRVLRRRGRGSLLSIATDLVPSGTPTAPCFHLMSRIACHLDPD